MALNLAEWNKTNGIVEISRDDLVDMMLDLGYGLTGSASAVTTTGAPNKLVKTNASGGVALTDGLTAGDTITATKNNGFGLFLPHSAPLNSYSSIVFGTATAGGKGAEIRSRRHTDIYGGNEGDLGFFTNVGNADGTTAATEKMTLSATGNLTIAGGLLAAGASSIQTTSTEAFKVGNGTTDVFKVDTVNKQIDLGSFLANCKFEKVTNDRTLTFSNNSSNSTGGFVFFADTGSKFLLRIKNSGVINMPNLPTSASGLASGDIWNNLGVLTIV